MTVLEDLLATPGRMGVRAAVRRHQRALFAWLGLLLVYLCSSLTTDHPGMAPTQRNWVYGRLDHAHTVGQTFVVEHDDLVALRVLLFANRTERDDPVTLRLRYAESELPDLAEITLPLRALARDGLTTFAFPPLTLRYPPGVVTTTLRLDLAAPTLNDDWVAVLAGPDTYPRGQYFANTRARPHVDLAFQPVYRQRWIDGLLPIGRMAAGKPGILGWPPLYALLAYGYIVVLVQAVMRLWRVIDAS
jgi:hypothetical protein